ncbi:hypothetical protein PG995_013872 [Apiospora arundinis]
MINNYLHTAVGTARHIYSVSQVPDPGTQCSQFPNFPRLPAELRQQIWCLALAPRITGAHTVQVDV